jgi:hypothetical protein
MPRGSRPGERRGGRQRATPNKRTVLTDRILTVASANPTASCDEFVAILVKDQTLPASLRVAIARKWFASARSRSADGRSKKGNAANAHRSQATDRRTPVGGAANIAPRSTTGAALGASTATNRAMVLVLLGIVQDSTTKPAERRQAASELAKYFLPKKPRQKKSKRGKFAPDRYGFVVDPDVARELRDTKLKLACLPLSNGKFSPYAVAQKATKLQARIKEIQDSLQCPCPSKYRSKQYIRVDDRDTVVDGEIPQDSDRLRILRQRRVAMEIFTPEEDLEEAIRTARYDSFIMGPEMAARHRLAKLQKKEYAAKKGHGAPFTPAQKADFRLLTLLYHSPSAKLSEELTEMVLAEHPFRDLPVADDDAASSSKLAQRLGSTRPEPESDEEFVEFDDDKLPPYCTIDRDLSDRLGTTVLKWTYEKYP